MADNFPFTPGTGDVGAAEDIASVKYAKVIPVWGPAGTINKPDVATGKPFPVQLRGSDGTDRSNALPVTGTFWQATQPVSGTFWQATQPVSGTFWQTTQPVSGIGYTVSASFTPAAASHVANDCNGAAATFTAIGPVSGRIFITSASLEIDGATAEATAWRVYLYNVTPPSATADDGAWDLASGDRTAFLGYVDIGTAVDLGSTQWVETHAINKPVLMPASGNLFGYLVNLTTLTPAAVAHIVTLHSIQV